MITEILTLIDKAGTQDSPASFYEGHDPVLIYGAGNMGRDVLRAMNSRGVKVRAFLDQKSDSQGQCEGIPVYPPDWDGLPHRQRALACVVVAVHNGDADVHLIINGLRDRGYGRVAGMVEFHDYFAPEMGDRFWLTPRSSYRMWRQGIAEGSGVWADEHSRQLYFSLLKFRLTGDYAHSPPVDACTQYFPNATAPWNKALRFVDGGAFDGDTLRSAVGSGYTIQAAAAFEPDPVNCGRLMAYISSLGNEEIRLWPCGIHSSTTRLNFAAHGLACSKVDQNASESIQVVSLDDVIPDFRPNLIKFDIEGSEYDGLLGARQLITQNHPGLAICLYHRPQDLWQIPLLVKSWNLGYTLHLRAHKHNGFEVVMYGTP